MELIWHLDYRHIKKRIVNDIQLFYLDNKKRLSKENLSERNIFLLKILSYM